MRASRPPRCCVFPYTSLFRSGRVSEKQKGTARECRVEKVFAGSAKNFYSHHNPEADTQGRLPQWQIGRTDQRKQDRKSTRLNSSHVAISYAGLCLQIQMSLYI